MSRFMYLAGLCLLVPAAVVAGQPTQPLVTGLKNPTAVRTGTDGKVYIATAGEFGRDGDGGIFVLDKDKAVSFASGLDDPKGVAGWGEWLYVTDKQRVWRINRQGKAEVFAAASAFPRSPHALSDIDIDESGRLYVLDNSATKGEPDIIFRIDQKGKVQVVSDAKRSPGLDTAKGMVLDGYSFLLVTDAATGELRRIKSDGGKPVKVADGLGGSLAWDKFGRLYGTTGGGHNLAVIPRPGEQPIPIPASFQMAGAIGIDPTGQFVLVPDTAAGTVTAVSAAVPGQEVDETPMPLRTAVAFPKLQWAGWKPENERGQIVALRPLVLTHAGDGSNRVFVATEHGVIHVFPNDQDATQTKIFLDLQDRVRYDDNQNEEGFLGLVFHPNFKTNGEFFVFYTTKKAKLTNIISRFRVSKDDPNRADPASEEELLRIQKPFWNHDGGTLCFGPDGMMYIAVGDGGLANDPYGNGQNLTKLLGKVLRIDVDHKDEGKPYAIPKDNPFVNKPGARPEVWAYGLRNVWRMAFDRKTGDLWASDVGQNLYEEIDLLVAGGNYGWNIREGLHPFGAKGTGPRKDLIDPIWEYHHDVGKSNTGGSVYRGRLLPELDGWYLYADYVSAKIWALRYDPAKKRVVANRRIADPNVPIMSFGEDEQGEVYFMTYTNSGQGIYRFVRPDATPQEQPAGTSRELLAELKNYRHRIVYESNRDGNWELYLVHADGSSPVNLTRTPDVDELYPRPSPDGTKICFVADEGKGNAKVRNVYTMNSDGTGRTKVADNAREPCWNPDSTAIAYMKGEFERFTFSDFATKGLFIYDLKTGQTRQHPNKNLHHLYTLNWSPDGKWFIATVHGGMGFRHGILAIEADGDKVFDLHLEGCRPSISPDGKRVAWGHGDYCAGVADLDLAGATPRATNIHNVVESKDPIETYHVVWSPDGKYLTFTRGPKATGKRLGGLLPEFPGVEAPGWNICVADAAQRNRWVAITTDGKSNKQPGWVAARQEARR